MFIMLSHKTGERFHQTSNPFNKEPTPSKLHGVRVTWSDTVIEGHGCGRGCESIYSMIIPG